MEIWSARRDARSGQEAPGQFGTRRDGQVCKNKRVGVNVDEICCSFCGKRRSEVRKLISGPNVYVCDECVTLCNEIIEQDETPPPRKYPRPGEILEELNRYAIGQDRA